MNTQVNTAKTYAKPELVSLGSAQQLTQNINNPGPGDVVFSLLEQS